LSTPCAQLRGRPCGRDHLGIKIVVGAAELRRPNFVVGVQCEQCHPDTARLNHDHPLAPAQRQAANPGDPGLRHRGADHPQRLDRGRAVGIEVERGVEIDRIDPPA